MFPEPLDEFADRWATGPRQLGGRPPFPNTVVEGDVVTSGVERQPVLADGAVYVHAADGLYALGPSS